MKKIIFGLLLALALVSCTSQQVIVTPTPTNTHIPSATFTARPTLTGTPYPTSKPETTATPIEFDSLSKSIVEVIDELFDYKECGRFDMLTPTTFYDYQIGKPDFIDMPNQVDFQNTYIDEIADSESGKYRAYLVFEPAPTSVCSDCVKSQLYVHDNVKEKDFKISWEGFIPSRFLFRLQWIGDNVLTFVQSISPYGGQLIGVDIVKQDFVYYAGIVCP